jgi:hypothetical protein
MSAQNALPVAHTVVSIFSGIYLLIFLQNAHADCCAWVQRGCKILSKVFGCRDHPIRKVPPGEFTRFPNRGEQSSIPGLENLTVLLLRHAQRRSLKGGAGMGPLLNDYLRMQVFHRMDSMLKDTNYTAELDALRRNAHETAAADMQVGATNHTENAEEDGQVSTSEALDMLRQVGSCQLHSSLLPSHTEMISQWCRLPEVDACERRLCEFQAPASQGEPCEMLCPSVAQVLR